MNLELAARQTASIDKVSPPLPLIQRQISWVQAAVYSFPASEYTLQSLQPLNSSSQLPKQVNTNTSKSAGCNCAGGNGILVQLVYVLGLLALLYHFRQRKNKNQG